MRATLTAAAFALLAIPATAATMTVTGDHTNVDPSRSVVTDGFSVSNVRIQTETKHGGNVGHRSPFHSTEAYGAEYFYVPKLNTGFLNFDEPQNELSFLWGSADTYNALTFFLGDEMQGRFTGADLGDTGAIQALGHDYVTVSNLLFDRAEIYTKDSAFEFSNVSTGGDPFTTPAPIPLPAAAWFLIAGLGGLGFMGRKARK